MYPFAGTISILLDSIPLIILLLSFLFPTRTQTQTQRAQTSHTHISIPPTSSIIYHLSDLTSWAQRSEQKTERQRPINSTSLLSSLGTQLTRPRPNSNRTHTQSFVQLVHFHIICFFPPYPTPATSNQHIQSLTSTPSHIPSYPVPLPRSRGRQDRTHTDTHTHIYIHTYIHTLHTYTLLPDLILAPRVQPSGQAFPHLPGVTHGAIRDTTFSIKKHASTGDLCPTLARPSTLPLRTEYYYVIYTRIVCGHV